ncbi:efflux RND transporter permease subunit [Kordiimonas marina]|uniref:efflux RND transporter permease subunit n=1 Tax=Kordiimonas marina TaxID=2872312 RepID=UPI001FF12FF6|nr:MMPL family transporter [Kordiimonas marina]MCJ9429623.1 MMPL family transporter [Kordiimonas marina]
MSDTNAAQGKGNPPPAHPDVTAPLWAHHMASFIDRFRWLVLLLALLATFAALEGAEGLKVSTKLESLMPEGARSVVTLNKALEKAGSFASIQVVLRTQDKDLAAKTLVMLQDEIQKLPWTESVQYYEDLSVLEKHKLLALKTAELENLEHKIDQGLAEKVAEEIAKKAGIPVSINLTQEGVTAEAKKPGEDKALDDIKAKLETDVPSRKYFVSDDGMTHALVIWPKEGNEGLARAKQMVGDIQGIIKRLKLNADHKVMRAGVAGRIYNKVVQYDAVIHDVVFGLGSSVGMILLLLLIAYRRLVVIPLIVLPLVAGILWTIGVTAVFIGGLNLITVFLALILFGLGIDFGIHNFSRYGEARADGTSHRDALAIVIGCTGKASLAAALTTAAGFYVLLLTEFRAFREFGFIAGSGICLIFLSMYIVFPAFLSVTHRFLSWKSKTVGVPKFVAPLSEFGHRHTRSIIWGAIAVTTLAIIFGFGLQFEKNFKNIQAKRTAEQAWTQAQSKSVFKEGHDRAVLVVDSLDEVKAIDHYFEDYIKKDTKTPTIAQVISVRSLLPDADAQKRRLAVIARIKKKLGDGSLLPPDLRANMRYLDIGPVTANDLPPALKRTFLGEPGHPGYLMYIYNSVTMDDATLAREFYDDAAEVKVGGKEYYPASEGFIFVEMLALMKSDALRAIILVGVMTAIVVVLFSRSAAGSAIILIPPALCLLVTVALMALTGLKLSIINMVILPSIIGIAVDNGIHLYERFEGEEEHITVPHVMQTTGWATTISTLTTLLGFAGLITASMGGLRSMGLMALIGFASCLVITWTLLPALLTAFERRLRRLP